MEPLVIARVSALAIRANITVFRARIAPGVELCAAVKSDAYGHGLEQVLPVLAVEGVERLAVANLIEALAVRQAGWHRPVLVFAPVLAGVGERERRARAGAAVAADLSLTVLSEPEAEALIDAARKWNRPARVEIKVDTGMGRMGLAPEAAESLAQALARRPELRIDGVYTHLATADEPDLAFAREQVSRFADLRQRLMTARVPVRQFHAANSAAIFRLPEAHLDRVRPGLGLYGYWGGPEGQRPAELRPAMRVVARLTAVRALPAGHGIGYGRTFITTRASRIGLVPIGYGDGYRRALSGNAVMSLEPIRGQGERQVPVVGRVSMDQTTIDVTNAGDVRPGDPVCVISDDPAAPHSVECLAEKLSTIPYEITCLLGGRVQRRCRPDEE